jgi:A/G-specific adenine glycosylase
VEQPVIAELRRSLLAWYGQQGRQLPWRETCDPYAIWVSEVMLQQTQVKTVLPYYQRWLQQFPTIQALAEADPQTVLKVWQGLGYYARARNLQRAAQQILAEHSGQFPRDKASLLRLPGIGRSTAGGILSAAFNQPEPILDGNVKRVLARLVALPTPPAKSLGHLWQLSANLLDPISPRAFNQAWMDLGATLCLPRQPQCDRCPWKPHCRAHALNQTHLFPMTETRPPIPKKVIGVAVIWNGDRQILIDRRRPEGLLGGLWEFPGGKLEPGETIPECIRREIKEELDIEIVVGDEFIVVEHTYSHFHVTLHVHHCTYLTGDPKPLECEEIRWVTLDQIEQFPFPKANLRIIDALRTAERER